MREVEINKLRDILMFVFSFSVLMSTGAFLLGKDIVLGVFIGTILTSIFFLIRMLK